MANWGAHNGDICKEKGGQRQRRRIHKKKTFNPATKKPWLVVPYSLTNNDFKFAPHVGILATGDDFFDFIKGDVDQHLDEARYAARAKEGFAAPGGGARAGKPFRPALGCTGGFGSCTKIFGFGMPCILYARAVLLAPLLAQETVRQWQT